MTHTTGPWFWEKRGSSYRLFTPKNGSCTVMDFTRMGMQGAQPRFSDRCGLPLGGVMIDAEELNLSTHPDARLIAAAPELLEALKNLVEACMLADCEGELSDEITGELMDAAFTAIDKAEEVEGE